MTFEPKAFRDLCQQATTTLTFDDVAENIQLAMSTVESASDLAPFIRERLLQQARSSLDLLEQRRTDPNQLLGAINSFLAGGPNADDIAALEMWFIKVAYKPDAAVTQELLDKARDLWRSDPAFNSDERLKDVQKRLKDVERFARTSVDLDTTLSSALGLERLLRSFPIDPSATTGLIDRLATAREMANTRRRIPVEQLVTDAFSVYEQTIARPDGTRLDQDASRELQLNLFGVRRVLERSELSEDVTSALVDRLESIEDRFDKVRFLSSSTLFKTRYEPRLNRFRDEVDHVVWFHEAVESLKALQEESKKGRTRGVDRLEQYHQQRVADTATELKGLLNARYNNPEALQREIRLASELITALDGRAVLTRYAVSRAQNHVKACTTWARNTAPDQLDTLAGLKDRCNVLWNSIPARYQAYVTSFSNSLNAFTDALGSCDNFRSAFEELQQLKHSISDPESGLQVTDRERLEQRLKAVQRDFFTKLGDMGEIERNLALVDQQIVRAARNIRRYADFDAIEAQAKEIGFRVGKGRFDPATRQGLIARVRTLYGRVAGLKRKRDAYLAERAASRDALFAELNELVVECQSVAQTHPGDHASWALLLDADRQLREATILAKEQHDSLRRGLEVAFSRIKEERAKFAREASLLYAQFLDAIQNIQQPLERSSPKPSREDAFEAIEAVKPLRARLRSEPKLLRAHREELFGALRVVSDAISEILDRASEEMQRNFVQFTRRLDALREEIRSIQQSNELQRAIDNHKALYADLRSKELSLEGRSECRSALEALWDDITAKRQEFGRSRFDPERVDATLIRLENQGYFVWMSGVPNVR
jgi:hypothetical protein